MALFGSCLLLLKDKMFCQLLQWPFMSSWIVKSCSLLFCWTPLWRSLMGNLMLGFTIWEVNWETTMSHLSLPSFSLVQCTVQSVYRFSLSLWSATAISDVARACRSKRSYYLSAMRWFTPLLFFWRMPSKVAHCVVQSLKNKTYTPTTLQCKVPDRYAEKIYTGLRLFLC